jgi:hypothetical protein
MPTVRCRTNFFGPPTKLMIMKAAYVYTQNPAKQPTILRSSAIKGENRTEGNP